MIVRRGEAIRRVLAGALIVACAMLAAGGACPAASARAPGQQAPGQALGQAPEQAAAQVPVPPVAMPPDVTPEPPDYATLAGAPDPRDFVSRNNAQLTLLGNPLRFGGFDIGWLGLRQDGASPPRLPSDYELRDALETVKAMGGFVVRSRTLAASVGCPLCLEPTPGTYNARSFAMLDQVLKTARNLGIKLILPLAGPAADCSQAADPSDLSTASAADGSICTYVRWRGLHDGAAFFRDPDVRAAFFARVEAILNHVNGLTGIAYRDDPAILAWENCAACGAGADAASVAAWSEALGGFIKSIDPLHLYEDGAFAGRIGPHAAHAVPARQFATPSVDIVGDQIAFPADPQRARLLLADDVAAVAAAGRPFLLDRFGWGPGLWHSTADLATMLDVMFHQLDVSGALIGGLEAHADQGGYLPPPPGPHLDGRDPLYYPGIPTASMSADVMMQRDRALRVFNYDMSGITDAPPPVVTAVPEIISATHGHVLWRGAAGAATYTIERSDDPDMHAAWKLVCHECVTDLSGGWQDPHPPTGPTWYRIMPMTVNIHKSLPSAAFRAD